MTQELLKILNPCRRMKVEDWEKITESLYNNSYPLGEVGAMRHQDHYLYHLLKRYEALASQPLKKEMFCVDVEAKIEVEQGIEGFEAGKYFDKNDYTKAQEKVWFEGFEEISIGGGIWKLLNEPVELQFHNDGVSVIEIGNEPSLYGSDITVFDLIIEIDRYNRTANEPITINFTEQFINQLLR